MPKYTQSSTGDGHPMLIVEDHKSDNESDVPNLNIATVIANIDAACDDCVEEDIKGLVLL